MMGKECSNGGIGFQNECICPYSFSGSMCENRDEKEQCNSLNLETSMFNLYPEFIFGDNDEIDKQYSSSVCCWHKYRVNQNYTEKYINEVLVEPTVDNIKEQSKYIKKLLETYGPWDRNDKLLFNYLLTSANKKGKEDYYLKYADPKYSPPVLEPFKITSSNLAFFLLVSDIKMEEIKTLFTYLYRPKHYYVIHVDNNFNDTKKIEELELYLDNLFKKSYEIDHYLTDNYPKNYRVMKDRFSGSWGSISLVYPEIAAYSILFDMVEERSAISRKNETWTHVINLSANDFPVKTVSELEFFLRLPTNINRNFLETGPNKESERYTETFLRTKLGNTIAVKYKDSNVCGSPNNNNPMITNTFYKGKSNEGSQWHFLTYKFAHYIISDFNSIRRLLSLKFAMIPDEFFYQQVRNESPFYPNEAIWDTYNYRFIPWDSSKLAVTKEHIEKGFPYVTYFTRKVYKQDVKDLIIKKLLHQ
ncbi:hypothetical protein DICPUDRAFT_93669 [Dictyostelium purpureum]|uniref:protein xylosyltransferase n=1 Tax=Dictyostelium purpureum TaxID=5786 RepID=F0ZAC6_DICPU|nr:uncharacterized protein DICPUDRAFT_93669 [Dictyostelium purpureum]EGC39100.1 hypothetical protein DICPUDRAFT_93669 [Dictyostelium purpureum]|eukprot:XP_003284352.1 hypothetical protein DICPUDRAFT_93669 [Dictyostelium purpureum]